MRAALLLSAVFVVPALTGCATVVEGNERALFYSARSGLSPQPVPSGWYWHLPWNRFIQYDLRWTSHKEEVHIHSKDNLHLQVDVVAVVRPRAEELFQLETDVGPDYYEQVVKPALYAATRDASAQFTHLEIATQTHQFEAAIQRSLIEHLEGKHLELSEVAIQHFDLPPEVETAANKKAAETQELASKELELKLAQSDAQVEQSRRKGQVEAAGLERALRAQQELDAATAQLQIEEKKREAEKVRAESEADQIRIKADAEADAERKRAEGEKARIAAVGSTSTNYVRLQAIEALSHALSGEGTRMYVVPASKDGMPAIFSPFFNPYSMPLGPSTAKGPP